MCLLAQTQPILFAHTQSDIETDGWSTVCPSARLSVLPQLSISRLARMSLKRTIVAMATMGGRESVQHCKLITLLVRDSGFLFTHVGKVYPSKKLGKYQGATIWRFKLSPTRPPWPPGGSGWPSTMCSHFWLQVDSSDVNDRRTSGLSSALMPD